MLGVLRDPGTILGHWGAQERTLEVQAWTVIDFWKMSPFEELFRYLRQKHIVFSACSQVCFSNDAGSESGRWGAENMHLVQDYLQKTSFHMCWDYLYTSVNAF